MAYGVAFPIILPTAFSPYPIADVDSGTGADSTSRLAVVGADSGTGAEASIVVITHSVVVGVAAEAGSALAVGAQHSVAARVAVDTEVTFNVQPPIMAARDAASAQAVPPQGAVHAVATLAIEVATSVTPSHAASIAVASELDSTWASSVASVFVGATAEDGEAQPVAPLRALGAAVASEPDSAGTVTPSHSVNVGTAEETDSAFVFKLPFVTAVVVSDDEFASAVTPSLVVPAVEVTASENAQFVPYSRGVAVGVPGYSEVAEPVSVIHTHVVVVGLAVGLGAAQPVFVTNFHVEVVGLASDTESGGTVLQTGHHAIPVLVAPAALSSATASISGSTGNPLLAMVGLTSWTWLAGPASTLLTDDHGGMWTLLGRAQTVNGETAELWIRDTYFGGTLTVTATSQLSGQTVTSAVFATTGHSVIAMVGVADWTWIAGAGATALTDSQGGTWTLMARAHTTISSDIAELWIRDSYFSGPLTVTATYPTAATAEPAVPVRAAPDPPLMDVTITAIAPWAYPMQPAPLLTVEVNTLVPQWSISHGNELSLQPVGFEVRVLAAPAYTTVLAVIADWSELVFGPALSDEGSGSITMSLDSPFWLTTLPGGMPATALLDDEHLWEVWENGQCRFQFLGMTVQEEILEASGQHAISVSGPGTAEVLKWAQIFPPAFPAMTGTLGLNWQFNMLGTPSVSSMNCWLQLLHAAQGRGTIPFVQPQFTATADSNGVTWPDIGIAGPWLPVLGVGLFDALNTATGHDTTTGQTGTSGQDSTASVTLVADWRMLPGFKLVAAPVLGTHREGTVIFYDNNSSITRTRVRSRQNIANYEAVVINSVIDYSLKTDSTSIAKWNQREMLSYNEAMTNPAQRDALAVSLLDGSSDEQSEWVLAVAYGIEGRMPFVDFDVGDWIGVEQYAPTGVDPLTGTPTGGTTVVESNRVVAIVIQVSADNSVSMELTLNSTLTSWQTALQRNIARALTIANTVPPGFGTNQASYSSFSATVSPTPVSTLISGWVQTTTPLNTHVSVNSGGLPSVAGTTALTILDSGSYAITLQAATTPSSGGDWVVQLTYHSFDSYAPATHMTLYVGATPVATSPSVSQAIYIPRGGYLTFSVQGTGSSPSGQHVILDVLKVS